jgi:hypothetical protein
MQAIGKSTKIGITMASTALLIVISVSATDYYWSNAGSDNDYMTTNNWVYSDGSVVSNLPSVSGDAAYINTNGADKCVFSGGSPNNIDSVYVGFGAGVRGALEVTGGTLKATANASRYTYVGDGAGSSGDVAVDGGTFEVNRFDIGRNSATGAVVVTEGTLKVARGNAGYSIRLSVNGNSDADLEISGGLVSTRVGTQINSGGTFTVKGSGSAISIGGAGAGDCYWDLNAGGTLAVQIDSGGLSPIEIDNDSGGSYAAFAEGAYLEPSFLDGYVETNAWVVMACEGNMTDNGLMLSTHVDASLWNFGVSSNPVDEVNVLWVGYAGAEYVPPVLYTGTNVYVEAAVAMPDSWNLYDPDGMSSLADQSSTGFTATFSEVTNEFWYSGGGPVVAQEFSAAKDLSTVGQTLTVDFDVELLDAPDSNGNDFRMVFYDTEANASWFWGIDLGAPGATVTRMLNYISASDTNTFVDGDYGLLGLGYDSLGSTQSGNPDFGLSAAGITNHITMTLSRISTNEVELSGAWSDSGSSTGIISYVFDESAPEYPHFAPKADGKWDRVNGFGFEIFDAAPFSPATAGRFMVSNFEVSYTEEVGVDFTYDISEFNLDSASDVTLILSDPIVGATYTVRARSKLVGESMQVVGSYVADVAGALTVPAADLSGITGDMGFFDVSLPVTIVVE